MKKRTLVCFLIFTLCVFYSSIPDTVFGQEEVTPEQLAEQVFEAHKDTLVIDAVNTLLPKVFEELVKAVKNAENTGTDLDIPALIQDAVDLLNVNLDSIVKRNAANQGIELTDADIALLKRQDVQALLTDEPTKKLLGLNAADIEVGLAKLKSLVDEYSPTVAPAPPTLSITTSPPAAAEQSSSFGVVFATRDANDDPVTVTGSISVKPAEAANYYSIPSGMLTSPVQIRRTAPTEAMPTIPGAEVTLTLVANDGTADSSPATFVVTFAEAAFVPVAPAPPTLSITTSPPAAAEQSGSFGVVFATRDANDDPVTVTGSISVKPAEAANYYSIPSGMLTSPVQIRRTAPTEAMPTIPGAEVTLTLVANDGTADSSPATFVVIFAEAAFSPEPSLPPKPMVVENSPLAGKSRLGGLALNMFHGSGFLQDLIEAAGIPKNEVDSYVGPAIDFILSLDQFGILPESTIRNIRTAQPQSLFQDEAQLDPENFGNAIMPSFVISGLADIYSGEFDVKKYLTSDRLNVYTRVPSTLKEGKVEFHLTDLRGQGVRTIPAQRVTPNELLQDKIPYTFRLEETLAATNLPAWPALGEDGRLFESVELRLAETRPGEEYSGDDGYVGHLMDAIPPMMGDNGYVWEYNAKIPRGGNVYYYFIVTLREEVKLVVPNREAIAAALSTESAMHSLDPTKEYPIKSWAMPDPRNLQLFDRGILGENGLFTPDLKAGIAAILKSPQVAPIIDKYQAGEAVDGNEFLNAITQEQWNSLQSKFLRNSERLTRDFERNFDPLLASVFSIPADTHLTSKSLWVAEIPDIDDSDYVLDTLISDSDDNLLDCIREDFTVDTSAPEATIDIAPYNMDPANPTTTGYKSSKDIYVATAPMTGTTALLNITSTAKRVGAGDGYLIYQLIKLDKDGKPIGTWLPLTIESGTLASDLWDFARDNFTEEVATSIPEIGDLREIDLNGLLALLNTSVARTMFIEPAFASIGIPELSEQQFALFNDLLGAVVGDINLIPITFNPMDTVQFAIQGENMPLDMLEGHWGIRAMGLDTRFNVGSYVEPTRLQIVSPEYDKTEVTLARPIIRGGSDLNGDGDMDEWYEMNHIFKNTPTMRLTVNFENRTVHPISRGVHPESSILVEYQDDGGDWQEIGHLDLDGDTELTIDWNVTDFDALVEAGGTVKVRAVATNALQLTDPEPTEFEINLDNDVYPVDPKVLVADVDESLFGTPNPDSGAPQGTIELIAYTPKRTYPKTTSLLIEVMRETDEAPIVIDTVEMGDAQDGTATAAIMFNGKALGEIYPSDTSMIHIDETSIYLKWTITIDTTMLPDTIEAPEAFDKVKLAAAHAASNPDGDSYVTLDKNRYMVRATPVVDGELPDNPNENPTAEGEDYTDTFSVDNVDDVAPLGQNMITVSQDDVDVTANEDGSFTVGGLVDKYASESPVITLTITPGANRLTYDSVHLFTTSVEKSTPEERVSLPGIVEVTETAEGSGIYTVTIDVGTLMNEDGQDHTTRYLEDWAIENPDEFVYNPKGEVFSFTAYALTEDKAENRQGMDAFLEPGEILNADLSRTTAHEITVNVQNTYRPDPGPIAIVIQNSENSDGIIEVNPDSGAPQGELTFSVYTYGRTSVPTEGIRVEAQRPIDDTWERITGTAVPAELVNVSEVAVTDLSDILTDAANAGIKNSGVLSALVDISEAEGGSPASLMKWTFTVDTRDLAKLDADAEAIKLDDTIERAEEPPYNPAERDVSKDENQYVVRAYALTPKNENLKPAEYPKRDEYLERGGVEAFFSLDNVDDVPPLGPTDITGVSDRDAYGDIQPIEANEDGSYTVGGIVDPDVNSPKGIFHIKPNAEPITYANGSLKLVQTAPDGTETEADGSLADGYVEIDVGALDNGTYMYHALTVDEHGNAQVQGEADLPSPIVTVHVNNFRVRDIMDITVDYVDGVKVDGELPERIPLRESIGVSFNVPDGTLMVGDLTAVHVNGEQAALAADSPAENEFTLMASELSKIASGHYTVRGEVTKRNGSVTFPLADINLDNTAPTISFVSPVEGEAVNDLPTLNAMFNDGDLGVGISLNTAMVDLARIRPNSDGQEEMAIDVEQSMVEQDIDSVVYTRIDKLAGGAYKFIVKVSDSLGNVGENSVAFAVEGIDPTVVITAPASGQAFDASPDSVTGFFSGGSSGDSDEDKVRISKFTVTVNGADVKEVDVSDESEALDVDGNNFTYTPAEGFSEGNHTVSVEVTDGSGLTSQTALTFIVNTPGPTVAIHALEMYDVSRPTIEGEFSGDADPVSLSLTLDGDEVLTIEGEKPFEFQPEKPLDSGEYKLVATVKDANGKSATATSVFAIRLPVPTATITTPIAGQVYKHGKPIITGTFSGADPVTGKLTVSDSDGELVSEMDVSGNDFEYTPALGHGSYTVSISVTDINGNTADASTDFTVDIPGPIVAIHSPAAGQMYDHKNPEITWEYSGKAEITSFTLTIDDGNPVELDEGAMSHTPELGNGEYTVVATVKDVNGKTATATVVFSIRLPVPTATITTPAAGQVYNHGKPIITGTFSGADPVTGKLTVSDSAGKEVGEMDVSGNDFEYTPANALGHGSYTVSISVTDKNGNTADASTDFTVDIPGPIVAIHSPAAGQMYDHKNPEITWEYSGKAEITSFTLTIDDGNPVELDEGAMSHTPELGNGEYTVVATVKDVNGKTATATVVFSIRLPVPTATITTPAAGQVYNHGKPIITGTFSGADPVTGKLTVSDSAGKEVGEMDVSGNDFEYTPANALGHGSYTVSISVTDKNGNKADASAEFMVDLPAPTVAILSPAPGQTYGNGEPIVIRVEASGTEPSVTSFTINDDSVEVELDDNNMFMHTPEGLTTGEYVVKVEVKHTANDKTAQDTVVFNVKLDSTPPVIAEVAPSGTLHDTWVSISAVVSDDQSDITAVDFFIRNESDTHKGSFLPLGTVISGAQNSATTQQIADGNILTQGSFGPGTHTLQVVATSEGGRTSHTWSFTVVTDNIKPTITSITPSGILHVGLPTISASAHDESGVAAIVITVMDRNGEPVEGEMQNDDEDGSVGITRADFMPEMPLGEGTYSIEVRATDTHGNSSTAKGSFTIDFDTAAPLITSSSPQDGARLMYAHDEEKRPTISITYGDAETGVNVDSIRFVFNDKLINLTKDQKSATQVLYIPPADLEPGQYTVKLEVSDNAADEHDYGRELRSPNRAVYEFSFFVEHGEVPILKAAPFNYPNPFTDNTRISFVLARRSNVSITIYDVTLRPVRTLVNNEVMEAGYYTRAADGSGSNAIGWDGKSSNGEDLARGIYYCVIMVTDGIEPEYAILKLALTR